MNNYLFIDLFFNQFANYFRHQKMHDFQKFNFIIKMSK